jgi:GxxExxY protein
VSSVKCCAMRLAALSLSQVLSFCLRVGVCSGGFAGLCARRSLGLGLGSRTGTAFVANASVGAGNRPVDTSVVTRIRPEQHGARTALPWKLSTSSVRRASGLRWGDSAKKTHEFLHSQIAGMPGVSNTSAGSRSVKSQTRDHGIFVRVRQNKQNMEWESNNATWCDYNMGHSGYATRSDIIRVIQQGCQSIITKYGSGNTEAFYQRMLLLYLYERNIPSVAEIDCFVLNSDRTPVLVGRIDIEVQHDTILEIKVAASITDKHLQQLRKYVNARIETGMMVRHAAVVCFTEKEHVDIRVVRVNGSEEP